MGTPDPWAELARHPHIDLVWATLPRGVRGLTDGVATIWLDHALTQRERRCTLAHELIHVQRGHHGPQPPTIEARVRDETARWLLPNLTQISHTLTAATSLDDAAQELWVTQDVLEDRLTNLNHHERHHITTLLGPP